jgi:Protein of unknown function (DUF2933)
MSQYLFLLLILACPLMMIFMMRGMHGGQGGDADGGHTHGMAGGCHGNASSSSGRSLAELRRQRDELDRQIEEREAEEQTPVGSSWR